MTSRDRLIENGKLNNYIIHNITWKTKSLLFNEIDLKVRNKYMHDIPEIYSHPSTEIDWKLANKLKSETEKI